MNVCGYTAVERKKKEICKKCKYGESMGAEGTPWACGYLNKMGKRRPCKGPLTSDDGKCKAFEKPGRTKKNQAMKVRTA